MSTKPGEQEFDGNDDGLTPEERAALSGDEDQGALPQKDWEVQFPQAAIDPAAATATAAAGRDDGEGDDDDSPEAVAAAAAAAAGAAEGHDPAAAKAAADAAAAAQALADEEAARVAAAETSPERRPLLVSDVPADAEEQLAAIKTDKEKLLTDLDEGDITVREYHSKLEDLNKRERGIELAQHEASLADKMEKGRMQAEWEATVHSFLNANPEWKRDADPIRFGALDQRIREIAGSDEGQQLNNWQILTKAKDDLAKAFGIPAKLQGAAAPAAAPAADAAAAATRAKPVIPPTLGKVPAADVTTTEGEFTALDRLSQTDPAAYEEEIAKLDSKTLDRYMQAG